MDKNTKIIIGVAAVIVLGAGAFFLMGNLDNFAEAPLDTSLVSSSPEPSGESEAPDSPEGGAAAPIENSEAVESGMPVPGEGVVEEMIAREVKEFSMTAYYDATGKYFSLKEMTVRKGDFIRIKITNMKGMHDYSLDEYGIKQNLPLNEEVVVEFVADKAGEFIYYCSMPGHRVGGQWGTLRVVE